MDGPSRLEQQIAFLLETDRLKTVFRQTRIGDYSRRENSAEHSWHAALAAVVLAEHANRANLDLLRVVQMLLVHDLVEIDTGDVLVYARDGHTELAAREHAAAERLFGMLPDDLGRRFLELWEEFNARATPEAQFAAALDRLLPVVLNAATGGRTWREHGVSFPQFEAANRHMEQGSTALWQLARSLAERALSCSNTPGGEHDARPPESKRP